MASADSVYINIQDEGMLPEQEEGREGAFIQRNQQHGSDVSSYFTSFGFIVERGELKENEDEQWGDWNPANSSCNPTLVNLAGTREGRGRGNFDGEPCILRFQKRWDAEDILWLIIKRSLLMSFQIIDIFTDIYLGFSPAEFTNQ